MTNIAASEGQSVIHFLASEYEKECLEYPFIPPGYDGKAALWAAQIVFFASQLLLYRRNKDSEITSILPDYPEEITPGAILSADLCLRFLPEISRKAKEIDTDDALVAVLETHLQTWHYSGIGYPLKNDVLSFDIIFSDKCLKQVYINRIIEQKSVLLAGIPLLKREVMASMGNFGHYFWKELQ